MFRPLRLFNKNTIKVVAVNTNRTKIIFSESYLDKAQRLKLWNLENKLLFGSFIESSKVKSTKLSKDKNRKVSKNKLHKPQTEVLVPFSLFSQQNDLKKEAKKKSPNQFIDSKLSEIISAQNNIFAANDRQLVDNVSTDIVFQNDKNNNDNKTSESLLCSGLPLEIEIPNTRNGLLYQSNVPSIIKRNLRLFPMLCSNKTMVNNSSDYGTEEKVLRVTSTDVTRKLPSVTKILDQTMSPESRAQLEKWKEGKIAEMGQEGFEKYMKSQLDTGSRYHDVLSKYLVMPPPDLLTIDPALKGLLASVGYILKSIKSPRAIESHVVHPVLKYQGVIDCIAYYKNKPTLIEWKTANKPKPTLAMTYDNPIQLAAYFGAISHDPHYKGLNVREALLVIAYTDGTPADVHHLTTEQLRQHWATWLTRLEKYWASHEPKPSSTEDVKKSEDLKETNSTTNKSNDSNNSNNSSKG